MISRLDFCVDTNRIVGDTTGLRQSGLLKGQTFWHCMQAPLRDSNILSHRSVHSIPEPEAAGIQMIHTPSAEGRKLIDHRCCFADSAIPIFEVLHNLSGLDDCAAELMSQNHR